MMSQPGKQTLAIHILININISRRKDNQTTKFGQLIQYSITKSYTKCGIKTIPGLFSK